MKEGYITGRCLSGGCVRGRCLRGGYIGGVVLVRRAQQANNKD